MGQTYDLIIQEAKDKKWNMLTPTISLAGLARFQKPVVETLQLSASPDDGDVYPASTVHQKSDDDEGQAKKGSKLRLTGRALEKLGSLANITWNLAMCGRTDNGKDPNYISWQAVGGITKPDGTRYWLKGEYDLDLLVLKEEIENQAKKRYASALKSNQQWAAWIKKMTLQEFIQYILDRDFSQKRKHARKLCETGAKNRVIRALLGLKNEYTAEEVAKPFVVARIVFQPDYEDPGTKQALLSMHLQSMMGVYGGMIPQRTALPAPGGYASGETIEIARSDFREEDPGTEPELEPEEDIPLGDNMTIDPLESRIADFNLAEKFEQEKELSKLILETKYDYEAPFHKAKRQVKELKDLTQKDRTMLFRRLLELKNIPPFDR